MISWGLLLAFAVLSYFYSLWFLVGVAVLSLWKLNRWYFYSSRPWRRVHFPMMRAYAAASGMESGQAERSSREFNLRAALRNLLEAVNPTVSLSHEALIEREFERCEQFYDASLIRQHLERKGIGSDQVMSILDQIRASMTTSDKGLMVRMVIAAVVEEQFSLQDRGEYMFEVFTGKAS